MAALRHHFKGRIVAGHCCSLTLAPDEERARIIDRLGSRHCRRVAAHVQHVPAGPQRGRTPRRGVAPLHELDTAGVAVMIASDNTRDPFYPYGDLDMLEVFREATRILHLDHSERPWIRMLGAASARSWGSPGAGSLRKARRPISS